MVLLKLDAPAECVEVLFLIWKVLGSNADLGSQKFCFLE
jgi:hypothetical protein